MKQYTLKKYNHDTEMMETVMSDDHEHVLMDIMETLSDYYPSTVMFIVDNLQEILVG
jgi:hypothetical protein